MDSEPKSVIIRRTETCLGVEAADVEKAVGNPGEGRGAVDRALDIVHLLPMDMVPKQVEMHQQHLDWRSHLVHQHLDVVDIESLRPRLPRHHALDQQDNTDSENDKDKSAEH